LRKAREARRHAGVNILQRGSHLIDERGKGPAVRKKRRGGGCERLRRKEVLGAGGEESG